MDWYPYSLSLVPPGTITAAIESYQEKLFFQYGDLTSQAFTPGIRLANYPGLPDDPGELRLEEAIVFAPPRLVEGLLYLPVMRGEALKPLRSILPPDRGASPYQPLVDGIPLCRLGPDAAVPSYKLDQKLMRSGSFVLVCFAYLFQFNRRGELIGAVEREEWRRPLRKPLAGNPKKQ